MKRPRRTPPRDPGESDLEIGHPLTSAAGIPAVVSSRRHGLREMGLLRTLQTPALVDQDDGSDCMGCAWRDPAERHHADLRVQREGGRGGGLTSAPPASTEPAGTGA